MAFPNTTKAADVAAAIQALANYNAAFVNAGHALLAPLMENDIRAVLAILFA